MQEIEVQEIWDENMMWDAYETMNKGLVMIGIWIVEKSGKKIKHINMVKKVAKMHLIKYQNSKANARPITLTFWHFSRIF
jgi:hypothetical protein